MAYPIFLINSATGSDTAASGAGPATAITGVTAYTRNAAGELRVAIDTSILTDVAVDGSHVLYMNSAAGQRKFSAITSKYDVATTGRPYAGPAYSPGSYTAGTTTVTENPDGIVTVGDVIVITGGASGGADLITTVATVTAGVSFTISDATDAGASGSGLITLPMQIGLTTGQGVQIATPVAWAIGGKRASIGTGTSRNLINNNASTGDLMGGWTVQFDSGHDETISSLSTFTYTRTLSDSTGPVTFEATPGWTVRPIIRCSVVGTATANVPASGVLSFTSTSGRIIIRGLEFKSTGSKTNNYLVAIRSAGIIYCDDLKIADSTNYFFKGIYGTSASAGLNTAKITNCEIAYCSHSTGATALAHSHGLDIPGGDYAEIWGNRIHDNAGDGIRWNPLTTTAPEIFRNVITYNGGSGLNLLSGSTAEFGRGWRIRQNTIAYNTGDGITITAAAANTAIWLGLAISNNNITHNTGYWFNATNNPSYEQLAQAVGLRGWHGNNVYGNGNSNAANPTAADTILAGSGGTAVDPEYESIATRDFTPTNTDMADTAYPTGANLYPGGVQPEGGSTETTLRNRGF